MGGSSLGPEVIRRSLRRASPTACACTCSTRRTPARSSPSSARSTSTRRSSSSPRSRAGRSRRSRTCATSTSAPAATARRFVAVTDPGSPLVDARARARLPARLRERPGHRRALLGAVLLRPRAGGADGRERRGDAAPGAGGRAELRAASTRGGRTRASGSACAIGELALHGRDKPTFVVSRADLELRALGRAADRRVDRQAGQGHPAGGRRAARRRRSVYGDDRVFAYLRDADEPDEELDAASRRSAGRATRRSRSPIHGAADLGRIFFFAEFATAVAGWALGINPFDQPNVQEAKDNTAKVLDGGGLPRTRERRGAARAARGRGAAALRGDHGLRRRPRTSSTRRSRSCAWRSASATKCTTTFGYGPRFLHSTGQFHKGGPPNGPLHRSCYHDGRRGHRDSRGRLHFEHLKNAQALGDMQTLRDHGLRPCARIEAIRRRRTP